MFTDVEQQVITLSQSLNGITDDNNFMKAYDELTCYNSMDYTDSLSYNEPCYSDGRYWSGKFMSHQYIKCLQQVNGALVLRIVMVSQHTELLDSMKYSVIGDMSDEERDNLERLEDDIDVLENFDYTDITEVAQFWFLPTGNIVMLARKNAFHDYKPSINWVDVDYQDDFKIEYRSGLSDDNTDYSGGWLSDTPLLPCHDTSLYDVLQSGISDSAVDDGYCDVVRSVFSMESLSAITFTMFRDFITRHNILDDFQELSRAENPIAVAMKTWGYGVLFSMFIAKGMASAAATYYHTIKIAHRNGFDASAPERQRRWMALLDNISFCNGNIEDPRNYMPANFDEVEAYWVKRVENKKKKLLKEAEKKKQEELAHRILSEKDKIARENIDYRRRRGLMLGIVIGNEDIELRVLQNVEEFVAEGVAQGHCVYNCGYHRFPDMLVFTARDRHTDKRLSTVTFDLVRGEVMQNLTKGNNVPEQFDVIEDLLNSHRDLILRDWHRMLAADPTIAETTPADREHQERERSYNKSKQPEQNAAKAAILARRQLRVESALSA